MDDSFIKLRKLQDKNADITKAYNKHKRKKKGITKNNGYDGICKTFMNDQQYGLLQKYIKEWKGLDATDINYPTNKKKILQNIFDLFVSICRNDINEGHMSNFRSLTGGFQKNYLTNNQDKRTFHKLLLECTEMKDHLQQIRAQQQSKQ